MPVKFSQTDHIKIIFFPNGGKNAINKVKIKMTDWQWRSRALATSLLPSPPPPRLPASEIKETFLSTLPPCKKCSQYMT